MAVWLLLLFAMALGTVQGQVNRITQTDIDTILSMHNSLRSAIAPVATDMYRVYWDAGLASSAQRLADSCPTAHSGLPNLGENLSWGWPTMTTSDAVKEWIKESSHYAFGSNTCAAGQVCAHYTQMIWNNSSKIGCGVRACPNILGQALADAWVCHYTTAGNVVGSKPYTVGAAACSACPGTTVCSENLCTIPGTPSSPAAPGNPAATPAAAGPPAAAAAAAQAVPAAAAAAAAAAQALPAAAAALPAAAAGVPGYPAGLPAAAPAAATPGSAATAPAVSRAVAGVPVAAAPITAAALPTAGVAVIPAVVATAPIAVPGGGLTAAPVAVMVTAAPNATLMRAPIGVVSNESMPAGVPLSPFTIVQSTNKTAISITESNPNRNLTNASTNSGAGAGGSKTIIGFQPRSFFG